MEILRTPDDRFADLPEYPFAPNYVQLDDVRMHYVDEGPRAAPPVLLLHGEPSWSYLYRKMIPPLVAGGQRVVAPDLIGFGRSDKPTARDDYTYQRHVDWLASCVLRLNLRDITLFCQDWGGLLGLRVVALMPDRFARIVAANTGLPTGEFPLGRALEVWRKMSQTRAVLDIGSIVQQGCRRPMLPEVVAAYDAPFPDETYKAGARQFPMLIPTEYDDPQATANRAAWSVLRSWEKPFLTTFSDSDPITRGADQLFQAQIPGTHGLVHPTIAEAGHFLQEDAGPELATIVLHLIATTP